jgi:hypothetical protein
MIYTKDSKNGWTDELTRAKKRNSCPRRVKEVRAMTEVAADLEYIIAQASADWNTN